MKAPNPLCPYRQIGRVQIVDMIPQLSGEKGEAWLEVLEKHFFRGIQRAVVINISNVIKMDPNQLRRLMIYMERPLKIAFYSNDLERAREIAPDYISEDIPLFGNEQEIVTHFGLDLIERTKDVVHIKERRRYKRFKVVMPVEVATTEGEKQVLNGIVTNVSEGGAFVQYMNIEGSLHMAELQSKPRIPVELLLKHVGTNECEMVKGYIVRVDILGQQQGVAIRFVPSLPSDSLLVRSFKRDPSGRVENKEE
jgi:hypothetical protein